MNISITGDIGSGKSTVASALSKALNMTIVDTGILYREYASKQGNDVLQQNLSGDWSIDTLIDNKIKEMGATEDNNIFVSRLAWHFIPNSIKIYLAINPVLAAKRICESKSRVSENHADWRETFDYNNKRKDTELHRYEKMYNLEDASGYSNADLVIMVGKNSVSDVVKCIIDAINEEVFGYYIDPKVLLPTQVIRDYNATTLEDYRKALPTEFAVDMNAAVDYCKGCYYIVDVHHRIAASVLNGTSFIRVPTPKTVSKVPDVFAVYDVEDMLNISLQDEYVLHHLLKRNERIIEILESKGLSTELLDKILDVLPKVQLEGEELDFAVHCALKAI